MSDEETHPEAFMASDFDDPPAPAGQLGAHDTEMSSGSYSRGRVAEEEEDDDDEEEEEEEEEEDDNDVSNRKRKRQRRSKNDVSKFLDTMAEVSDDGDEEDEGEDLPDGFFAREDDEEPDTRRRHAQLDSRRQIQDDRSAEEIAKALKGRYAGQTAVRYTGDMNEIPQRLLMPSVHDASLWQIRVKPGREREIVYSLMRKAIDLEFTARPLNILSAFQRDSLPGMVYVEARSSQQVNQACQGLVGVYLSRGIHLVPIDEMASLLMIKKAEKTLQPGSWVRLRRGRYVGDLAQVMDIDDSGDNVGLRLVPRIDLTPKDDDGDSRKRKKPMQAGTIRPPQRLFNPDDVATVYGKVPKRGLAFLFQSDTYKEGFLEKDFKTSALITEDIQPTLDEITMFSGQDDEGQQKANINLGAIVEAKKKAAISVLQPGDHIEVFEGEQTGVYGSVDEINQDVVTFTASNAELEGQKIEVPAASVRKRFKPGDHVKVMHGQNTNETGLVVAVAESVVTFISDMSLQEISVFAKDLREAAEIGSSTNTVGNYELHDLVQLDGQTVGVIFKTERDSFRVLDQNGQVRLVQPHQISVGRDSRKAISTDSEGHEIRIGDLMKEVDGEGRRGHVLHVYQSMHAFLHNRDITENGGVFVTRARSVASVAPKGGLVKAPVDLSKMNPAMVAPTGGMVGSGMMTRGPRDRLVGTLVVIVKGPYKSYVGVVRDTNGQTARVELHTGNKLISIDKARLRRRQPDGTIIPLDTPMKNTSMPPPSMSARNVNPYAQNWSGGQTPSPANNGGRTPAWNTGRTPNPYGEGSRTPAWNTSSKTPNPYADSGRTPAWNASSRTPNPYGGGTSTWGATSPGRPAGAWGGSTPGHTAWGATPSAPAPAPTPAGAYGGATPGRQANSWGSDNWGTDYASAPTPAAAPTPGMASAPTPSYMQTPGGNDSLSAPTPGFGAPTPYFPPSPGAGDGDDEDYEPDEDWMFQLDDQLQRRVRIQVQHPSESKYLDNKYLNGKGVIVAAYQARPGLDTTVTVKFDEVCGDENDVAVGRSILSKYVRPIQPTEINERVVVLDGPHKNQVMIVRETPDSEGGKVTLSSEDDSNVDEFLLTRLAILSEAE